MYRLLSFKSANNVKFLINRRNLWNGNVQECSKQNVHELFNKNLPFFTLQAKVQERFYSTSKLSLKEQQLVARNRKKIQKYVELLQVSHHGEMKETTTPINKLKAKRLTDFIKSAKNTTKQEAVTKEAVEILPEILEDDIQQIEPVAKQEKASKKKVKTQFKGKYHTTPEMERLSRQKSLAISLNAYFDCCVQNEMLNRAFLTLKNYRSKYQSSLHQGTPILDVSLYNILLQGFAEKENLLKVRELLEFLREDQIQPNEQTFASHLECLGRLSPNKKALVKYGINSEAELTKLVSQILQEASQLDITPNSVVDKSIFMNNQRNFVINAIRLVHTDFTPVYTPPDLLYDNKMLNELNRNVKEIAFNPLEHLEESLPGSEIMNSKKGFTQEELTAWAREQLSTELNGYITIASIQNFPDPTPEVLQKRIKIEEMEKSWRENIVTSFTRDLNTLMTKESSKTRGRQNLLPYLRVLETNEYASILLREIRFLAEGSESFSPTVKQLYRELGKKVQLRYQMKRKQQNGVLKKTGEIYTKFCTVLTAGTSSDNPRQCWQRLVYQKSDDGPNMNFNDRSWTVAAEIGVGRFLYNILMRDLKIDINSPKMGKQKSENLTPAFYTLFRNQGKMVKEEVKPHPILTKLYKSSQQETLTFSVDQVPMLCPPQPWTTPTNGGYLLTKSDLIRLPQTAQQQISMINSTPLPHLYPALDSLNQLASIPWTVNRDILHLVLEIFNSGGDEKLKVPEPASSLEYPVPPANEAGLSKEQKQEFFRQKMNHRRHQAEMYSLWCDALYRLSLANHFKDRVFWLPHNMDFRGRVYPVPPHLNHLGADLSRSLLVFHQKKKLGVDGFMWLKLHCINLTGMKKRDSVRERLLYAEEVMDEILDSADNPLTGRRWWTKSDEPWQTLSCCIEIAKVHRSGDPENYESGFPIHQDGSCNGLQHYAALGRDKAGAFSVNLCPADAPQDVYSEIANLVEKIRKADEEKGDEVARVLRGFVRRKTIKQTVMTTVYGVTRYGARLQIAKQLKALDDFPQEYIWSGSSYLTSKTFESLREMFTSAKEIQDWFTECARLISGICSQNVEWVTPLGFPVVQPYHRQMPFLHNQKNCKLDSNFAIDSFSKPNIMKQKNAFPPNFIHSLDSSHMMLTSLFCEKAGLTFISIHDCFWTHACTVPDMNKICRNQFVALHSQPILEDLSKFMVQKYSFQRNKFSNDGSVGDTTRKKLNRVLQMVPEKGDFDLYKVLQSIYFFS